MKNNFRNLSKRTLALLLSLVMCLGMLPGVAYAAEGRKVIDPGMKYDEYAEVTKTATRGEEPGTWDITMTVKAKDQPIQSEPLHLVLVLDTSGSMAWCTKDADHTHSKDKCGMSCTQKEHEHEVPDPKDIKEGKDSDCYELDCKIKSHTHTHTLDKCYKLTCEETPHTHTDECYLCGKEEHSHKGGTPCVTVDPSKGGDSTKSRQYIAGTAAKDLLGTLSSLDLNVTVSIVTFADGTTVQANNEKLTTDSLGSIQDKIPTTGALNGTYTDKGLETAYSLIKDASGKKAIILLSDGEHNKGHDPTTAAGTITTKGIELFAIGFAADLASLKNIVSKPPEDHYFTADDYSTLTDAFNTVASMLSTMVKDNMGTQVAVIGDPSVEEIDGGTAEVINGSLLWNAKDGRLAGGETRTIKYTVKTDVDKLNAAANQLVKLNGEAKLTYEVDGKPQPSLSFPLPTDELDVAQLTTRYEVTDSSGKSVPVTDTAYAETTRKGIVQWSDTKPNAEFTATEYTPGVSTIQIGTTTYYHVGTELVEAAGVDWGKDAENKDVKTSVVASEPGAYTLVHKFSDKAFKIEKAVTAIVDKDGTPRADGIAKSGDTIKYKVTVQNLTPASLNKVVVKDILAGISFTNTENVKYDADQKQFTIENLPGKTTGSDGKVEIVYSYVVQPSDKGTGSILNAATSDSEGSTNPTPKPDPDKPDPDPNPDDPNVTETEVEKLKISGFNKEVVTKADTWPEALADVKDDYTIPATEDTTVTMFTNSSIKLLYKITVTGDAGAAYKVTDEGAAWVAGAKMEGTLPETKDAPKGTPGQEVVIYVSKTFADVTPLPDGTNAFTTETVDETTKTYAVNTAKVESDNPETTEPTTPIEKEEKTPVKIEEPVGAFTIDKQASIGGKPVTDTTVAAVDDVITYTVTVKNTGNTDLTAGEKTVVVTDSLLQDTTKAAHATVPASGQSLPAGVTYANGVFTISNGLEKTNDEVTIVYTYTVQSSDKGTKIENVVSSETPGAPEEPAKKDVPVEKLLISKIEKSLVMDNKTNCPAGLTADQYKDGKVQVPEGGSVTLRYKLTVSGDAGAKFAITDDRAKLYVTDYAQEANVKQAADGTITGVIPGTAGVATTFNVYVTKTFTYDPAQDIDQIDIIGSGLVVINVATVTPGDEDTTVPDPQNPPTDDEKTDVEIVTPVIAGAEKKVVTSMNCSPSSRQ